MLFLKKILIFDVSGIQAHILLLLYMYISKLYEFAPIILLIPFKISTVYVLEEIKKKKEY